MVRALYKSLADSGQSEFYEPSDWAYARLVCELLNESMDSGEPKAAVLSMFDSAMVRLLVTEGDRRRMRLELQREDAAAREADDQAGATISDIRSRLAGA